MKCMVMWLNMCCFIIERHQIRVWAVKVGFDPRQVAHTVTYIDISTSSCSLQYQLSFKARMASVGWVGSKWLDSECEKGTYWDISPVNPLCQNSCMYIYVVMAKVTVCGYGQSNCMYIYMWFWPTLVTSSNRFNFLPILCCCHPQHLPATVLSIDFKAVWVAARRTASGLQITSSLWRPVGPPG